MDPDPFTIETSDSAVGAPEGGFDTPAVTEAPKESLEPITVPTDSAPAGVFSPPPPYPVPSPPQETMAANPADAGPDQNSVDISQLKQAVSVAMSELWLLIGGFAVVALGEVSQPCDLQ
ncbi:hypothetical protein KIPB_012194 [Kipferlia bialata]|uniref:Uncharacterized protein n=1 Tax=Kipferlia bialata TaxID=797122 RepID=A0A391NQU7_9EUKA|nr:hypothetical protein KIPB_012194 [Kipferlia bialata]|eukprot:g12194.t1